MVEQRIEEGARVRRETTRESTRVKCTREGTHTRFQGQASESGGEVSVPRDAPEVSVPRDAPPRRENLEGLTEFFNPFVGSPWGEG